jgi:hypothetical protein
MFRYEPESTLKYRFRILTITAAFVAVIAWPGDVCARYRPGLDWRTVREGNVTIYYPRGHEAFARRVRVLTSEVKNDVDGWLGITSRSCAVVLNPDTDVFNGFYAPLPNRISLFETPNSSVRGFGPASDLLDLVYTHEYTHFAHITTRLGWYGALSRVFGDGISLANGLAPGWLIEGLPVMTETRFTDGGRGRDSLFSGTMYSFSGAPWLGHIAASTTPSPYSPSSRRSYLAGYFMTDYLTRTYGDDAVPRLIRRQARHPVSGTAGSLREVTGVNPEQFFRSFNEYIDARAKESREHAASSGLPGGRVILGGSLETYSSHWWTACGTLLALRTGYDKKTALVEADPRTGSVLDEIPTGRFDVAGKVRQSKDGVLVYGRIFYHPLGEGDITETDLASFDPSTRELRRITRGMHVFDADLSPDGCLYAVTRRNGMWIDLALVDDSGKLVRVLCSDPGVLWEAPRWSSDGSMIAVVRKADAYADIVLVNPATGEQSLLFAADSAEDNEPAFSPDGRWIVFTSARSGSWDVYAWDRQEKRLSRLTAEPFAAGLPELSPDGNMLAYTSLSDGMERLCVLPFDPGGGIPVVVSSAGMLPEPDLTRITPDIPLKSDGIPLWRAYKPYVHAPWADLDEDGSAFGIMLLGGDPLGLNTYQATVFRGTRSGRMGYDISFANRSFWPVISFRAYDSAEEGDTVGGGTSYWYRERGGEASLGLTMVFRTAPSLIGSNVRFGSRLRVFDGLDGLRIDPARNRSLNLFAEYSLSYETDHARRDMILGWGREFSVAHEWALSGGYGELPGFDTFCQFRQSVPSPFEHHGFVFGVAFQRQSGALSYAREASIPRGYTESGRNSGLDMSKNLLLSADYRFPIRYLDTGFGVIAGHIYLLKGTVFADYGRAWNGSFGARSDISRERVTIGGMLSVQGDFLAWIPLEAGVMGGYKTHEDEPFAALTLKLRL